MSVVTFIDEDQAPQRVDGRGLKRSRNIDAHTKQCRSCGRILPFRLFVPTGNYIKSIGRKCGSADCRTCLEQQRRAAGVPKRMVKVNSRGEVWCSNCKRYLPSYDFRVHPNAKKPDGGNGQKWWAYCKACCRELDRLRWRGERRERLNRQGVLNKRRRQQGEFTSRREFLAGAIELLQRRGLTISAIARIVDGSLTNIYKYREKACHRPTKAVLARFERLLLLTMDWPHGEPAFRNRLPHPKEVALTAVMQPTIAANPVRSRWKGAKT
jgi:hypothetical protein